MPRLVIAIVVAGCAVAGPKAQDPAAERACARLLPAIERLEARLSAQAARSATDVEVQRIQVVTTLLGLRYHSLDSLEASLRAMESEEGDIRSAIARTQVQIDALEEAARSAAPDTPDAQRKAQRADYEAVMKGLDERAKALRESKAAAQGETAIERADIQKLEGIVRSWLAQTP